MVEYASTAEGRGLQLIIAGAGGAAHLPGMVAANTLLPVLGVPVESAALKGMDSLLSIVEAAATLGMSKSYLYRNADKFSFVRREGRALRFSARGVQEYLSGRRRR